MNKKIFNKVLIIIFLVVGITLGLVNTINAATAVNLGTADAFAILAGSTVTNTGTSVITGDLGLSPGTSVTGFPPGTITGTQHITDATASQAQIDLTTAYNAITSQPCLQNLSGQDLGGLTLTPGVYCFDTSAQLTGTLTLDGQNDLNSVFIFKIGSTLTTASASVVSLINDAQACKVSWQVGSSATLGTNSTLQGNILALTSITLTTGANINGRVLARNAAVTLDTNIVSRAICAVPPTSTPTPTPTLTSTPIPTLTLTPSPTLTTIPTSTLTLAPSATLTPTSTSNPTPSITPSPRVTSTPTPVPGLPNTRLPPKDNNILWIFVIFTGTIFGTSTLFIALRKRFK